MKVFVRPALAFLLLASSATLLTACDYASLSPGYNPQAREGFGTTPTYTNADVNADSINNQQTVTKPIGVGSATAIKKGGVQAQLNSGPAGQNVTSPQTASGQMGPPSQNQPSNASKKDQNQPGGM